MEQKEFEDLIKQLCDISNKLHEFEEDDAKFLETIKSLDRAYLEKELAKFKEWSLNYKGVLKPVNFVKYVIIKKILDNEPMDITKIEEIKDNLTKKNKDYFKEYPDFKEPMLKMEDKNYFHSWDNFKILFYVYYDQYKDKVKSMLLDITEHLKVTLNLKDTNTTTNGFGWNNNFGNSDCWLVLYPQEIDNHQEAYQVSIHIFPGNKVYYGAGSGAKVKEQQEEEQQDGTKLDIPKLEKYLFDVAKPKYEEWNKDIKLKKEKNNEQVQIRVTEKSPKNLILYGPPGTGKTYIAYEQAVKIVEPNFEYKDRKELIQKFKELNEQGLITFVTFHQSYSYEEFIEGYRYDENTKIPMVEPGVFKTLVESARSDYDYPTKKVKIDFENDGFFKMSLGNTNEGEEDIYDYCIENGVIALGYGRDIDYSSAKNREAIAEKFRKKYPNADEDSEYNITAMDYFRNVIEKGDIIFVSMGNRVLRAIGKVTGGYEYNTNSSIRFNHFRKVDWLLADKNIPVEKVMKKNFSQMTIYELNSNHFIKENVENLLNKDDKKEIKNYVMVIDEINRGNISKIFGELITLIEEDKRIGMENEMQVTLPYSKSSNFAIPPNIYILGTMNTADRSIALMDVALRRRFTFKAMIPNAKLISDVLSEKGLDQEFIEKIQKTFEILNKRIEVLLDRDHTIGHSYFLNISPEESEKDLHRIWYSKIIPLLQEYFYNDWDKLKFVLGQYHLNKNKGFVRVLGNDYKGIFDEEYDEEFPCEIVEYPSDSFSEVLNKTFVNFKNGPSK